MSEPSVASFPLPAGTKSLFVSVGDRSAAQHCTRVLHRIRELDPQLYVWGMGSLAMEATGMHLEVDFEDYTAFGIVGGVQHLPRLFALRAALVDRIVSRKPDAVLLVDYGGFHLSLAKMLKKRAPDIPVIFLISPQVWGSRPWRAKTIARVIDRLLVIFPFEETWYTVRGMNAKFVGHPLARRYDSVDMAQRRTEFCEKYSLDPDKPIIGIFPGSRKREIEDNVPPALDAVRWLASERPEIQFVVSQANQKFSERMTELLLKARLGSRMGAQVKVAIPADNTELMYAADILWAKSGTTTLEAALMKKPMLIFYRADWFSWIVFLLFKRVKFVGLPNLLTGGVVPELFQLDCRAEQFVKYTRDWIEVPAARQSIVERLAAIDEQLGSKNFDDTAATEVLAVIASPKETTV